MKRKSLLVLVIVLLLLAPFLVAGQPDPKKTKFLIYPAKAETDFTELQRLAVVPQPRNTVIINASAAIRDDKTIDPTGIDLLGLQKALHEPVRIRIGNEKRRIAISLQYRSRQPNEAGRLVLYWALKGMALDLGYDEIDVLSVFSDDEDGWWKRQIEERKAYDLVGRGQPAEPGVGDEFVTVYAVKTAYSRHLFDADCVVNFKQSFVQGWDGTLTAAQETAVLQAAATLKFDAKRRALFRMATERIGPKAHSQFHEKTAVDLIKKMGFEKHATYSSG